jgi:hypothetical protein
MPFKLAEGKQTQTPFCLGAHKFPLPSPIFLSYFIHLLSPSALEICQLV